MENTIVNFIAIRCNACITEVTWTDRDAELTRKQHIDFFRQYCNCLIWGSFLTAIQWAETES